MLIKVNHEVAVETNNILFLRERFIYARAGTDEAHERKTLLVMKDGVEFELEENLDRVLKIIEETTNSVLETNKRYFGVTR